MLSQYLDKVFFGEALRLLRGMPSHAVDAIIADPMYGVAKSLSPRVTYDWGSDPFGGDHHKWWEGIPGVHVGHRRIYRECRRFLKPGGTLAWAMGCKFRHHFADWFGGYRIWSFTRFMPFNMNAFGHIWLVQTHEQEPVPFPNEDSLIVLDAQAEWLKLHPCPKAVEEMEFLSET